MKNLYSLRVPFRLGVMGVLERPGSRSGTDVKKYR